jgi:hypothetical protein
MQTLVYVVDVESGDLQSKTRVSHRKHFVG